MPFNDTIDVAASNMTPLNASNITAVSLQNKSKTDVLILASAGATPADADETQGFTLAAGIGDDFVLADRFKGITGPVRLFCYSKGKTAAIWVSHA